MSRGVSSGGPQHPEGRRHSWQPTAPAALEYRFGACHALPSGNVTVALDSSVPFAPPSTYTLHGVPHTHTC